MVFEFQRNVPGKRVVSRQLCSGDVAGNKLSWDAPPRIFPATSPWHLPSFILLYPCDVASIQCEIFLFKWYSNFNATSPGKGLYPGGYARETLLGISCYAPHLPSDVSIAFAFFYSTVSMGRCVGAVWNFRVEMVCEMQRIVSRRLCLGDVAGNIGLSR